MNRSSLLHAVAHLAILLAGGSGFAMAAETAAVEQDLVSVKMSDQVRAAVWKRLPDSYTLQVVLDPPTYVNVSDALKALRPRAITPQPQPIPKWRPGWELDAAAGQAERGSRFIAETIANLRSLDPAFGGDAKDSRVGVWLLKADGTLIQPATYSRQNTGSSPPTFSISYGFPVADSAQAVAAAIRINDDFYIEKLQPLGDPPASQ
jgi:hypothetical protein